MATEHEHWLGQSEIYALGALDGHELVDYQAHLASGCTICAAYLRETQETLSLLHRSLRPLTPPSNVKQRVLDQVAPEKVVALASAKPKPARPWLRLTGTIAAGVVGLVVGGSYYRFQYEPRHTVYSSVINLLRDPATRDYPLYGTGPSPQAKGRFLWNASGEGHIFVNNLPRAVEGSAYAVWTIAAPSAPRFVGTIRTDAKGNGGLHINTKADAKAIETFAVTLEPDGPISAPTGPMVLVSKPL
jgi:anti-sigma-K factor RskA